MFRMAIGHSDDIDLDVALKTVFAECDAALAGARPKAALLLAAWEVDHQRAVDAVRRRYPGIELAGTTTAGEMSSVMGYQQDSIELVLFAADSVDITGGLGRGLGDDPVAAVREAVASARARTDRAPSLCIVMPSIGLVDAADILEAFRSELGPDVPILGGGAAPENPVANPAGSTGREFAGDAVVDGGISILLFSGPLDFAFGVQTGWRGVGPRATVTKVAADGRVEEIDGRRAVEFFDRYLGSSLDQGPPIANPLAVFDSSDPDAFYLRTATYLDAATGSVTFFGLVPEGATVQFTVARTDEIIDGARASVADALTRFPDGRRPDAALFWSCATRRFLLGTRTGREVEVVRGALGEATPVAGFYCLGEIAPIVAGDVSRFHNATLVALVLGSR